MKQKYVLGDPAKEKREIHKSHAEYLSIIFSKKVVKIL